VLENTKEAQRGAKAPNLLGRGSRSLPH